MLNDLFRININAVIFSTDIPNNKKYVLSTNDKDIQFPVLTLDKTNISSINTNLINYLKNYVFVSDLELLPQIISTHSELISVNDDIPTLNMIYGFVINHTGSLNNSYWIEFDYLNTVPYSSIIFEVIQKLK